MPFSGGFEEQFTCMERLVVRGLVEVQVYHFSFVTWHQLTLYIKDHLASWSCRWLQLTKGSCDFLDNSPSLKVTSAPSPSSLVTTGHEEEKRGCNVFDWPHNLKCLFYQTAIWLCKVQPPPCKVWWPQIWRNWRCNVSVCQENSRVNVIKGSCGLALELLKPSDWQPLSLFAKGFMKKEI